VNLFQSAADLLCVVLKYKMLAVEMFSFIFVRFYGITTCRTSNLAIIWNFVQVRAIETKLWPINGIQNGGGRHLKFIIFFDFGHTIYFVLSCDVNMTTLHCSPCFNNCSVTGMFHLYKPLPHYRLMDFLWEYLGYILVWFQCICIQCTYNSCWLFVFVYSFIYSELE